jgi:putative transposase
MPAAGRGRSVIKASSPFCSSTIFFAAGVAPLKNASQFALIWAGTDGRQRCRRRKTSWNCCTRQSPRRMAGPGARIIRQDGRSSRMCLLHAQQTARWTGWCRQIRRSCGRISMRPGRPPPGAQGAAPNDKIPEPGDHGIGRSRGGLTTKVHALVDAGIHPVALLLSAGQAGDNPRLVPLLDALTQAGHRPEHLLADKAHSHPSTRRELRHRRIRHTIPNAPTRSNAAKAKDLPAGGRRSSTPNATTNATPWNGLWPVQAVARHRHSLRQVRPHLPRRRPPRRERHPRPAMNRETRHNQAEDVPEGARLEANRKHPRTT